MNRGEQRAGAAGSVAVILLDGLNTNWTDQADARTRLMRFLSQLRPEDRVAIYALTKSLHVIQDFSSDSGALVRSLWAYRGQDLPDAAGSDTSASPHDSPANQLAKVLKMDPAMRSHVTF